MKNHAVSFCCSIYCNFIILLKIMDCISKKANKELFEMNFSIELSISRNCELVVCINDKLSLLARMMLHFAFAVLPHIYGGSLTSCIVPLEKNVRKLRTCNVILEKKMESCFWKFGIVDTRCIN